MCFSERLNFIPWFWTFFNIFDKLYRPHLNKCFKRYFKSFFVHSSVLSVFNVMKHNAVFFFVRYHKLVTPTSPIVTPLSLRSFGCLQILSKRLQLINFTTGMWKRKRLFFCGSGSTLVKEVGSGSELESESVEKELEAEAIFSKSGDSGFLNWLQALG